MNSLQCQVSGENKMCTDFIWLNEVNSSIFACVKSGVHKDLLFRF